MLPQSNANEWANNVAMLVKKKGQGGGRKLKIKYEITLIVLDISLASSLCR